MGVGSKAPVRPKGSDAKSRYSTSIGPNAPYRSAVRTAADAPEETVNVKYSEGAVNLEQVWVKREPHYVSVDWRTDTEGKFRQKIKLPAGKYNTLQKMLFHVGLPMNHAHKCVGWFNERMPPKPHGKPHTVATRPWTIGEIIAHWGLMAAACLCPSVPLDDLWSETSKPGDLFDPIAIGRHGVHRHRHRKFRELAGLMFTKGETELNPSDPWRYSRPPIDDYNAWRFKIIEPSYAFAGDESMSLNLGEKEGVLDGVGADPAPIPCASYVERKPDPYGNEIKVLADGDAGNFLRLKIEEGERLHTEWDYHDEYGHTTAVSIHLLKPWFPPKPKPADWKTRIYGADSWFMGVKALEGIYVESDGTIYPFGDVKTNTARFDKEALASHCGAASGDWAVMTTQLKLPDNSKLDVMGVAHRRGPEVHTFISSHGTTLPGNPQKHKDDDLNCLGKLIPRKCPQVLNEWTKLQPKIDIGNKRRQFLLAIERRYRTSSNPFRLFSTMLGIALVDTYELHMYHNVSMSHHGTVDLEFKDAIKQMAYAMLHNNLDAIENSEVDPGELFHVEALKPVLAAYKHGSGADGKNSNFTCSQHIACRIRNLPGYVGAKQHWCVVCGKKTTEVCAQCSWSELFLPIHNDCMAPHRADPSKHRKSTCNPTKGPGGASKAKNTRRADDDTPPEDTAPPPRRTTGSGSGAATARAQAARARRSAEDTGQDKEDDDEEDDDEEDEEDEEEEEDDDEEEEEELFPQESDDGVADGETFGGSGFGGGRARVPNGRQTKRHAPDDETGDGQPRRGGLRSRTA